ncbi:hypothetical protein CONPUDRAFT_140961 [Coniophora puteana RWD-64-598 SS2]|uniref:Uncharacterized protein n=1 Tax=Coniophora puteana (strain RWD-64-598) TaxID=741705 RepID=A0A5M3N4N2_CONPW|nr:uncharacterized protein CONPUDRAFT_140961 [Coniophora puteana RWD-64-598 SS2]EIW86379.1 hypothetical protein CONPUDRAFT_140961 [Coniophora puteana RWD-64-598 SS2]
MARATRSTTNQQEKDKLPTTRPTKQTNKKRKRTSLPTDEDQPASKQPKSENGIKSEQAQDPEEPTPAPEPESDQKPALSSISFAGDDPIDPLDAQKILDVLESLDDQGLLDRVFPLPSFDLSEPSTSTSQAGTCSLRTLLRESSQHPLKVLHAAISSLLPESHQPRSQPSKQLRFCTLALSLLDQASFRALPTNIDIDVILGDAVQENAEEPVQALATRTPIPGQKRKYALMQRLPTGNWWTSLSSDFAPDTENIKKIQTMNAELVAILPTASSDILKPEPVSGLRASDASIPTTLGTYVPKKPPGLRSKLPGPRMLSRGSFLDYGPFSSFAPSFDQDGVEIGQTAYGEVLWDRLTSETKFKHLEYVHEDVQDMAVDQEVSSAETSDTVIDPALLGDASQKVEELDGILTQDQIKSLKVMLNDLDLEQSVQDLLDKNSRALRRLEQLQVERLKEGNPQVQEGSEEWDIAQGIFESLVVLTSLRPRAVTTEEPPLIPPASTLHKLQRTLPSMPAQGWYGSLPAGRASALRDDSTLYIKSDATVVQPTPITVPSQTSATPTPTSATPSYAYSYSNYATPYRQQAAYPYKPGQNAAAYYPNQQYGAAAQGQGAAAQPYYANQQQYNPAQGQHQQYGYSSWYQFQPQPAPGAVATTAAAAAAKGTTSGRGTPQPGTPQPGGALPTSYAGFFNAAAAAQAGQQQQQQQQRAVANTVLNTTAGAKAYQPWSAGGNAQGYAAPTIPSHLRNFSTAPQTPQTPGAPYGGYTNGFHQPYQVVTPQTQSS